MKRIRNLLCLTALTIVTLLTLSGCCAENHTDSNGLQLISSYELVAAKVNTQAQLDGSLSGSYLLGFGGVSGNLETKVTKVYDYWYKREDGGIVPATIDLTSYTTPEGVTIVIYENDAATPKVEIWRNSTAINWGDGLSSNTKTEFRFTIPSGSFVNTYDLQGLSENAQ